MQTSPAAPLLRRSSPAPRWLTAALILLCACPVQAEPTGGFVQGDVGVQRFSQGGGAPAICCAERDEWTSWGPTLRVGGGWRLASPFAVQVDAQFATSTLESDGAEGPLHRIGATLGVDWRLATGALEPSLGLGLTGMGYFGEVTEPRWSEPLSLSGMIFGAQLRGGLRYWAAEHLAVGADVRVTAYAFSNQAIDMTLGVTYAGF